MGHSLKRLFERKNSFLAKSDIDIVGNEVESDGYITVSSAERGRYVPPVDFTKPENFARFGSAEKYYSGSIEHIYNTYPYDGSRKEVVEWHNSASHLDNFVLDQIYPRTNGYVRFSHASWGSQSDTSDGYGLSDNLEYIQFRGGPHTASGGVVNLAATFADANLYSVAQRRESNLKLDGAVGNTVEFWLRKAGFNTSLTEKEVVLDVHTSDSLPAAEQYGRLTIELSGTTTTGESPIWVTYMSGTSGIETAPIGSGVTPASVADDLWHHYALSFSNTTGSVEVVLYIDGEYNDRITSGSTTQEVTGALIGNIGALISTPANLSSPALGWGKLSGSIDDFRFWKTRRSSQEIGRNWFTNVYGGANTDDANVDLGVYFKFNEGMYNSSITDVRDAVVLDYSGRISNGSWTGYAAGGRETGSAMVQSSASAAEFRDPIIYQDHGEVAALKRTMGLSGSVYDRGSNTNLFLSFPQWIVDEDEKNNRDVLKDLTQIIASYFDDLYLMIEQLPHLKQDTYYSGSFKPAPFANALLESSGFVAPELFVDATIIEELTSRNEEVEFTEKIYNIKNLIYQNIYNNLVYIYKSKGTENAFRNLIRCFGVDDELIKLSLYSDNTDYLLRDNVRATAVKKSLINFNTVDNRAATVYQQADSSNANSVSFIVGEVSASYIPRTIEAEMFFPKKAPLATTAYATVPFMSSSLFGMHTANRNNASDLTWQDPDRANFQVYAVRDQLNSNNAYFVLTGTADGIIPTNLTSSLFEDVYDNQKWNFAVRVVSTANPWVDFVTGSTAANFEVQFYGCNIIDNRVQNEFDVSGSVTTAAALGFTTGSHRVYVGAHRTDFAGALRESSDARASSLRYWLTELSNEEIQAHAKDAANVGVLHPYRSAYTFEEDTSATSHVFVPRIETLALNWDFLNVTGSDAGGQFLVDDASSGSADLRTRYEWLGTILKNQHTGLGNFFGANATNVVNTEYLHSVKQNLPENLHSSDMIDIVTRDDLQFTRESRPIKHFFAFEKSMYQTISEEMLNMFATIVGFNNLIGEPVNRYRQDYKDMAKLRYLFFEGVSNTPDLDKFVEFYKWLDSSMATMLQQLVPASAIFSDKLHTMVESHILERNKYWTKFPTLEFIPKDITGSMDGINKHLYNWKFGHHPISGLEEENQLYWKERAERTGNGQLVHDDAEHSEDRALIHSATLQVLERRWTTPYRFAVDRIKNIHGGINYKKNKKINVLQQSELSFGSDPIEYSASAVRQKPDYIDIYEPNAKFRHGFGDNEERSDNFAPFNLHSSSVDDGYNTNIATVFTIGSNTLTVTNLHSDAYGADKEIPMQGPFTDAHVGGHQHRHVDITYEPSVTSSGDNNRPEAWIMRFNSGDNILSLYPPDVDGVDRPRASYSRDGLVKRPVNISNIAFDSSSAVLGNYDKNYQIVSTTGRRTNNLWFVDNEGISNTAAESIYLSGAANFSLPSRTANKTVIVERFAAPGGPDVSSRGVLDVEAEEYAVHNALPWRNLAVRMPLNIWSSERCEQFGIRSGSATKAIDYDQTASYHKVNRNTYRQATDVATDADGQTGDGIHYVNKYDNLFVQHAIPRSDSQYAWVTGSVLTMETLGYVTSSSDYVFVSASDFGSVVAGGTRQWGDSSLGEGFVFTDFVGLNTNIYEPVSASENFLGKDPATNTTRDWVNHEFVPGEFESSFYDAQLFNAMMLNRNGPYGYPLWKQIRTNEHAVVRNMVKNNRYSRITRDGPRGAPVLTSYTEPPVTSKFKPLTHTMTDDVSAPAAPRAGLPARNRIRLRNTYGNNLVTFANASLERDTDATKTSIERPQVYDNILRVHGEENNVSVTNLLYRETIYPKHANTYLDKVRNRDGDNFVVNFWAPTRAGRKQTEVLNSQGFLVGSQSMWPLDARENFTITDMAEVSGAGGRSGGGEGELLSGWTTHHSGNTHWVTASAVYTRRNIADPFAAPFARDMGVYNYSGSGDTLWEVGTQAGKNPFYYRDYDEYVLDLRSKGKDYTIIPEFRISDHIEYYISENNGNFLVDNPTFLSITGAVANTASAADRISDSDTEFFKTYSHSDFLRHFEFIKEDYGDSLKPSQITLRCQGLMRMVPYDGFYPVLRTLELATLFSRSYGDYVTYTGGEDADYHHRAWRTFLAPMFAPGIMYNTIKSGLAVDYPIMTGDWNQIEYLTSHVVDSNFDRRFPFEALVEPENYLAAVQYIVDVEPDEGARLEVTASWNGVGNLGPLYKMAMHNFLAESTDLFLENGQYTSFKSLPQGHPDFGRVDPDIIEYTMDIKLAQDNIASEIYQVAEGEEMMYSSASAFGPPCGYKMILTGEVSGLTYTPFAPPYHSYAAYARLRFSPFKAVADETKYTLDEIISHLEVDYAHGFDVGSDLNSFTGPGVDDWMQISASINLFGTAKIPKIEYDALEGVPVRAFDDMSDELNMWVVEPKFETIILDFSRAALDAEGRYPANPTEGNVCRGMWHQYGNLPSGHNGLTLQIKDSRGTITGVDEDAEVAGGGGLGTLNNFTRITSGSLADLVGFRKESKTLGTPPLEKTIREAVVAVPFVIRENEKQFFPISRAQIRDAKGLARLPQDSPIESIPLAGESVRKMVSAMEKYVIPPKMNFLLYEEILPFVMYFLEFEHRLTQQDLIDIWQNIPPSIGIRFKHDVATFSHELKPGEFFQPAIGAPLNLPNDLRWMVFKVKQKAKWNYFEKTSDVADDERFSFDFQNNRGQNRLTAPDYSWNWPYDYFSLVELVKMDAEIEFHDLDEARRRDVNVNDPGNPPRDDQNVEGGGADPDLPRLPPPGGGRRNI
tara:strand:- start:6262 stop:14673 length:8412 start_codon:yes stop_codon:yes gene_type:complete